MTHESHEALRASPQAPPQPTPPPVVPDGGAGRLLMMNSVGTPYKSNPVVTHSSNAPGDPTLEPEM